METVGAILSAVIVLLIVIGMYVAVSYKHSQSGLSKGCNGNCATCGMRSEHCEETEEKSKK